MIINEKEMFNRAKFLYIMAWIIEILAVIVELSKGGEDTVENAVALCPNCHRKMHSLCLEEDILTLQKKGIYNEK